MYMDVNSSIIYSSQKVKNNSNVHQLMSGETNALYTYNGILVTNEKECDGSKC